MEGSGVRLAVRPAVGVLLAVALVLGACTDNPGREAVLTGEAVLAPWTRVLDENEADALEISEDRIVVPADHSLADAVVDDVVSIGLTDQTPDGLLRRVTDITPGDETVVLTTRQALLEEAFESADVTARVPLTLDAVASTGEESLSAPIGPAEDRGAFTVVAAGVSIAQAATDEEGTVELEETDTGLVLSFDKVLFDADEDEGTTQDQVRLSGSITVDVDVEVEFEVDDFQLEHALVAISGGIATNILLDAEGAGPFSDDLDLLEIRLLPILVPMGPIVVPVQPTVPVELGWDGEFSVAGETSITTSTTARMGVVYDDGWKKIATFDPDYDFSPPAFTDADPASVHVYGGPGFRLRVWESLVVASMAAHGTIDLELLGSSPWYCLYAGVRARANIDVLGSSIADGVLFEEDKLLAHESCPPGSADGESDGADDRALPPPVAPVPAYSTTLGTCTQDGGPVGEWGRAVAELDDGGVLVAASRSDSALWLVRLDAAGDVIWSQTYPTRTLGRASAIVPSADGGAVVGLEFGNLLYIDAFGDVTDVVALDGLDFLSTLIVLPGGDGLLAGGAAGSNSVLVELDLDGTVRWARQYSGTKTVAGVAARPQGGWTVALSQGDVFTTDASGAVQSAVDIDSDDFVFEVAASPAPGGGLGIAAVLGFGDRAFEVATVGPGLDLTGGTQLTGADGIGLTSHAVHVLADGSVVVAGETKDSTAPLTEHGGLLLARVAAGTPAWVLEYGAGDSIMVPYESRGAAVAATDDGGLIVVGTTWRLAAARCGDSAPPDPQAPADDQGAWDLWVLKVPRSGLIGPRGDSGLTRSPINTQLSETTLVLQPSDVTGSPLALSAATVDGITGTPIEPVVQTQAP